MQILQSSALTSVSWAAGGAFGLAINIFDGWNLDIRSTYLRTGPISYYNNDDIENWKFNYLGPPTDFSSGTLQKGSISTSASNIKSSPAQLITFNVGITFLIN